MGDSVRSTSSVGVTQVADLLDALRALGADTNALRLSAGLSEKTLQDAAARIQSTRLLALLERAGRELRDPLIGLHAGARVQTRGPLFYLLLSSPRLSDGLILFSRFAKVPLDTQVLSVSVAKGVVDLTVDLGDAALAENHNAIDYIVGANLSSLRRAVPSLQVLGVDLSHAEVGAPGETERTFACPVRFGCRHNALRFSDSLLTSVPAAANPAIADQIEKLTAAVFARITATSTRDRVAEATRILIARGVRADRAAVAKHLHLSERTLHRQLEQESVSFTVVRDGVRADLAQALLSNRALKVETVALSVGFADVASFSKAFTRWMGCAPARYRERLEHKRSVRSHPRRLHGERVRYGS